MSDEEKIVALGNIPEIALCKYVLVPLLKAMGYEKVIFMGGSKEYGVDIYFQKAEPTGKPIEYVVVVETRRIHKRIGKKGVIHELLQHIKEALLHPVKISTPEYEELRNPNILWVLTSKEITEAAKEFIRVEIEKELKFRNLRFFDNKDLLNWIERYFSRLFYSRYFTSLKGSDLESLRELLIYTARLGDFDSADSLLEVINARLKELNLARNFTDFLKILLQVAEELKRPFDYIRYGIAAIRTSFLEKEYRKAYYFFNKIMIYTSKLAKCALDNLDRLLNMEKLSYWSQEDVRMIGVDPVPLDDEMQEIHGIRILEVEGNVKNNLEKYYAFLWYGLTRDKEPTIFLRELIESTVSGLLHQRLSWEDEKSTAWEGYDWRWLFLCWINSVALFYTKPEVTIIAKNFLTKIRNSLKAVASECVSEV